MQTHIHDTSVAIIGAGVAGLTLATFLQQAGVRCIVIERRGRAYIETRQRAGVIEARAADMFGRRDLASRLLAGPVAQTIDYRINGASRIFDTGSSASRFCTQQMLVNNLLRVLLDEMHGDVRFGASDVLIRNESEHRPQVCYRDGSGVHTVTCDYIAGCDGDRGVSRASIPAGVLTTYHHSFGYAWLAALVEAPVTHHPIMAVSDHGFVAQLPRGPHRSRYYLQCVLEDTPADWPDTRIWDAIRLRLNDADISNAIVHDKECVPLRSVVHAPMQYRKLFLAGDVAHLVPPAGAKGMNMALFDVDVLATALAAAVHDGDATGLENYSATVLPHVWRYQEFSAWMTDTMHDAGDPTQNGLVRQMMARARLDALFDSPDAARLHGAYQRGMV